MENIIFVCCGGVKIRFRLNRSGTALQLLSILPLQAKVQRWGGEIYFPIPLDARLEQGKELLEVGDIAFWPPGQALCIFFGHTPASTDHRPRAAGPVTVVGHIARQKDIGQLRKIKQGQAISLIT